MLWWKMKSKKRLFLSICPFIISSQISWTCPKTPFMFYKTYVVPKWEHSFIQYEKMIVNDTKPMKLLQKYLFNIFSILCFYFILNKKQGHFKSQIKLNTNVSLNLSVLHWFYWFILYSKLFIFNINAKNAMRSLQLVENLSTLWFINIIIYNF